MKFEATCSCSINGRCDSQPWCDADCNDEKVKPVKRCCSSNAGDSVKMKELRVFAVALDVV